MDYRANVCKRKQSKLLIRRNFYDYSDYVHAKLVNMRRKNKRHGKEIARTLHKTPLKHVKHRSWFKQMLDNPVRYALLQMISNRYLNRPAIPITEPKTRSKKSEEVKHKQEDHQASSSSSQYSGAPSSSLVGTSKDVHPKTTKKRVSDREVNSLYLDLVRNSRKKK